MTRQLILSLFIVEGLFAQATFQQLILPEKNLFHQLEKTPHVKKIFRVQEKLKFFSETLELQVEGGSSLQLNLENIEEVSENKFALSGNIYSSGNSFYLRMVDGRLYGTLSTASGQYEVRPIGEKEHVLMEIEEQTFHPQDFVTVPGWEKSAASPAFASPQAQGHGVHNNGGQVVISLLLLTSPGLSSYKVEEDIYFMVSQANDSFKNSHVNTRIQVADILLLPEYMEAEDDSHLLKQLRDPADGAYDQIHTWRDETKADITILLIDDMKVRSGSALVPVGGQAYLGANDAYAFGVVNFQAAKYNHSLSHEIGHLIGANHNPEVTGNLGYNQGILHLGSDTYSSWRSIMAYGSANFTVPRIALWSNPDVSYNGLPLGSSCCHNNALTLNQRSGEVASFRDGPIDYMELDKDGFLLNLGSQIVKTSESDHLRVSVQTRDYLKKTLFLRFATANGKVLQEMEQTIYKSGQMDFPVKSEGQSLSSGAYICEAQVTQLNKTHKVSKVFLVIN